MGITIGLLIPLLGTMLGAAFVFFMKKDMSPRLQKSLLGFASGVMIAASVWSLLIPSIEMETGKGAWSVLPAAIGFLAGVGFLLLLDELTPQQGTLLPARLAQRHSRAYRRSGGGAFSLLAYPYPALHALIRRRRNVLCGGRRTDSRGLVGRAFQPEYHWFCHRFCVDDDFGCSYGINLLFLPKIIQQ